MSIERVVAQTSASPLLGGLDWRPPSGGVHSNRALHEAKSHTDSTHFTLLESKGLVRYGLYKARASEESIKLPRGVVSAAACFANLVGEDAPNAALVLPIECDDDRAEQKYLVIVLEDGVPHIDVVVNEMAARDTIGSEERPMWAFNKSKYPNCQAVDFAWLATGSSKSARVLPIPINPWPIVLLIGLSSMAGLGWWFYQNVKAAEAAQRQAALVAAADPVPKYLAALRAQAPHMAARREDVLGALPHLLDFNVIIPGWHLTSAECGSATQQCTLSWARKGGTLDDIKAAMPTQTLVPVRGQGTTVPMIDVATTITNWPIQRESLLNGPTALPSFNNGMVDLMPLLQIWRTAGLDIDIKPATLWPSVPGVPNEFRHPAALHRGQIVISGVPGPFIQEVLTTAPGWIQWETVRAELGEGGDIRNRLSFKATGNYYVSTN